MALKYNGTTDEQKASVHRDSLNATGDKQGWHKQNQDQKSMAQTWYIEEETKAMVLKYSGTMGEKNLDA